MNRTILDKAQLSEFILKSKYQVNPEKKFISRCIDGRYKNNEILPALAIPGADAGELALIFATSNSYGFEINVKKVWKTLVEVVGGEKNLQFHTDSHADRKVVLGGCGHMKQIKIDNRAYDLTDDQLSMINDQFSKIKKSGVIETELYGDHQEVAVVLIRGNWGVYPQATIKTQIGEQDSQIFTYHQTLIDERHKILAKKLIDNKAIILPNGCDEEYLYEALSETSENHLMETVKRLAMGLPIYQVIFQEEGNFKIIDLGKVE